MLEYAYVTDKGLQRELNEDSIALDGIVITAKDDCGFAQKLEDEFCVGVFDGVGGKDCGEIASAICAESFCKHCKPERLIVRKEIYDLVEKIQNDLLAEQHIRGADMMTTFVGASLFKHKLTLMNIGDSRAYLFRNNVIKQYSFDDTYLNYLKKNSVQISETDYIEMQHIITKCFGIPTLEKSNCHSYIIDAVPGDTVLLMSDGISDIVDESELSEVISKSETAASIAKFIAQYAVERGAHDNYTIVVLHLVEEGEQIGK